MGMNVTELTISYYGNLALKRINLQFESGSLTGIIGPNGAGKSTLIKGILNLIPKSRGSVLLDGKDIKEQQKQIAYVAQRQSLDLSFPIDVLGVVLLGTYPKLGLIKRPGKKERRLALSCLEKVGMADFAKQQIAELSGGQLQRVFLARALAQEATWIFLDEPFVGIDAASETIIIRLLKTLRDEGKSIVIVHHDLHKVTDYFDQLIILNKEVIASGPVARTFTMENMKRAYGDVIGELAILGGKTR